MTIKLPMIVQQRYAEAIPYIYRGINTPRDFSVTAERDGTFVLQYWSYGEPVPTDDQIEAALNEMDSQGINNV